MKAYHELQSVSITIANQLLFRAFLSTATIIHGVTVVSFMGSFEIWAAIHTRLFVSLALYRALLRPLARTPGPLWAKISKIQITVVVSHGRLHEVHTEWARNYRLAMRVG